MKISVREATAQDYNELCELIDQVDALHRDNIPQVFQKPTGPVREKRFILKIIMDNDAGLFVAEATGQLVGFIHVTLQDTPEIPLFVPRCYVVVDTIAVRKDAQRNGIGRALMDRAQSWAESKGASDIELNVHEFNEGAKAFYQSLGYETLSRRMGKSLR